MKSALLIENMRLWAVLPASGTGSRFGGETPKQYLKLNDGQHNKTVMQHSVDRLCDALPLLGCVIPISKTDTTAHTLTFQYPEKIRFTTGGAERMDSVYAGLLAIEHDAKPDDWVLVHDVARPCIHSDSLIHLVNTLADDEVGGVLAIPVRDTLKRVADLKIVETVSRDQLWQVQTPQMFRYATLVHALKHAQQQSALVTDEASAIELLGLTVNIIAGRADNIKLTYPEDLALARAILWAQTQQD